MEIKLKKKSLEKKVDDLIFQVSLLTAIVNSKWTCPVCGWKGNGNDIYDHIIKAHSKDYYDMYYSHSRLYNR